MALGDILVIGNTSDRIYRYSSGSWDSGLATGTTAPQGVAVDSSNGEILFVDTITQRIYRRSGNTWTYISGPSGISAFSSIAVDPTNGNVLVAESEFDGKIYRYSSGSWDSGMSPPTGVLILGLSVAANGDIIALDFTTKNVYRYSSGSWDSGLATPSVATNPRGVTINPSNDDIYISDSATDMFYRYSSGSWDSGTALPTALTNAQGIAFDAYDPDADVRATQTIILPLDRCTYVPNSHIEWSFVGVTGPAIDAGFRGDDARYLARVGIFLSGGGSVRLIIDSQTPPLASDVPGTDLSSHFEQNGTITIAAGGGSVVFNLNGADTTEPYLWSPTNGSDLVDLYNSLSSAVDGTLTLDVFPTDGAPDLIVDTPTRTPTGDLNPNQSFTLSATVRNQGVHSSAATTLLWYRSNNNLISASDTQVGTTSVPALSPGGTSAQTISLSAPSNLFTYHYGAIVGMVAGEALTGNNISGSVEVSVVAAPPPLAAPNFVDDTGDAQSWTVGTSIGSVTVPAASGNPTPTYSPLVSLPNGLNFNSDTRVISGTPTAVGSGTITIRAANSEGNDYWTVGYTTSAAPPVAAPDLEVGTPTQSPLGNLTPGQHFTLTVSVMNNGDASSSATTLRWRSSTDNNINTSDTQIGTDPIGILSPAGARDESIPLNAPSTPGTYYYGATVDSFTGESDATNNASGAIAVVVTESVASSVQLTLTQTATQNVYTWTNPDGYALQLVCADVTPIVASSNYNIALDNIPTSQLTQSYARPSGQPYYAMRRSISGEFSNTVGPADTLEPDLTVDTPTRTPSGNLTPGESFTLNTVVRNGGSGTSTSTTLRWRQSTNSNITTSDPQVGIDPVGAIAATGTSNESIILVAPNTPGTYYYGATVDPIADESNTGNNASGAVSVIVALALTVPNFADDTGNAQNWTVGTSIPSITVPAASGNPAPTYAAVGNLPGGINFNANTRVISGTPTGAGSGTIRIRAMNSEGSDDWTVGYAATAALTVPSFADDTGNFQNWVVGTPIAEVTVPLSSGNPIPTYAAVSGLPSGITFNAGTRVISGTPTAVGSGTIRIRATNSEGDDDWTVGYTTVAATVLAERGLYTLTPTISTVAPTFADNTGDAQTWVVGTAIAAITVPAASGSPAPTYTVVGALPSGINFNANTRVISGTPAAVGSSTIRIRAMNSEGSADWTISYVTSAALSIPSFADNTGDAQSWTVGSAIANITVPLASGNPVPTYSLISGAPAGINFNAVTRIISGTPTGTGSGTIRIRATNSEGDADWTIAYSTSTTAPAEVARMLITVEDDANKWYSIFGGEDLGSFVGDAIVNDTGSINTDLRIDRVWWTNNANRDFRLNRNPNGAVHGTDSDFSQYFGSTGPGADYSVYVRIGSTVYEIPVTQRRSIGGHYLNLTLDAADAAVFNSVSVGDTVAVVIGRNLTFTPPTADAGNDQSVTVGQSVALDGSGSSGDNLSYSWRQISGQTVVLIGEDTSAPSFTAPSVTGDLVFELRVTDNVFVVTDNVTVTVSAALTIPSFADDTGDAQSWTVGTAIAAITVSNRQWYSYSYIQCR